MVVVLVIVDGNVGVDLTILGTEKKGERMIGFIWVSIIDGMSLIILEKQNDKEKDDISSGSTDVLVIVSGVLTSVAMCWLQSL